jgi:hypothetical protein
MEQMTLSLLFELLSSWQFISVCIGIMLLLPLVFYLASIKPPRRLVFETLPRDRKKSRTHTERTRAGAEDESKEHRESRSRKAIEDGDEIEYKDRK